MPVDQHSAPADSRLTPDRAATEDSRSIRAQNRPKPHPAFAHQRSHHDSAKFWGSVLHNNSLATTQTTYLYALYDNQGNFLKIGVTGDPPGRYPASSQNEMQILDHGSRSEMFAQERSLVERWGGPDNREPWSASRHASQ